MNQVEKEIGFVRDALPLAIKIQSESQNSCYKFVGR